MSDTQIGGTHYRDMPIQPIDFILKNKLGFCEGNIVKALAMLGIRKYKYLNNNK